MRTAVPALAGPADGLAGAAASLWARASWIRRSCDPTRRPWGFALLLAICAGLLVLALALLTAVVRGDLTAPSAGAVGQATFIATLMVGFEATLVLLGYATLGRYLGLRGRSSSASA